MITDVSILIYSLAYSLIFKIYKTNYIWILNVTTSDSEKKSLKEKPQLSVINSLSLSPVIWVCVKQ